MAFNLFKNILKQRNLSLVVYSGVKQLSTAPLQKSSRHASRIYNLKNNEAILLSPKVILNEYNKHCYSTNVAPSTDEEYINEHNITIIGKNVPSPFRDIDTSGFPDYIKNFLKLHGITNPTVIQSQGWPVALEGNNFVGIAQTGTGKTLAFLLPAVVHLKEKEAKRGRGPRVLVLAPTRELARQIEKVAKQFETSLNIRCLCVYGGANRSVQAKELRSGIDILIATPGRLNDFIDTKETSLSRCTYVVLDEADRMLDMGFEPQIRKALEGVPLERQILMFSATWPKEVQYLAKDYLGEFIQVNVGSTDLTANHNITQHVHIVEHHSKMDKFKEIMHAVSGDGFGKILVFTNTKRFVDNLELTLKRNGWPAVGIHGDKTQYQRDVIINKFRSGRTNILVATDVAARGLDVDGITHVINYDFPQTSEDYIHRIGRTGRSQNKGTSHTILTSDDGRNAKSLLAVLKEANQEIPQELEDLARDFDHTKEIQRKSKQQNRGFNFRNTRKFGNFHRKSFY
ncbi:unnamed protein product [Leptidea sinapis]|uniref:RNA helicase n=1 Tax=Leptidea sinapis TaxID=189913 RepID=A0A5E4Q0B0_9NEOP|nr:unnamed protein product [Leptidea sinapis]